MEKFSVESGADHKYADLQAEKHIREEVDTLLDDKELLKKRRGEIWKGAHDILDDLINIVLDRIKEKPEVREKYPAEKAAEFRKEYPRELVKKIIAEHKDVELKESADKLNLKIDKVIVAQSDLEALKRHGLYPKI